uniref:Uncharacterized protein n=1 Tax=Oryctolagus cuniculus TaxID=9986 RepID=A0A5F9CNH4_RABIT
MARASMDQWCDRLSQMSGTSGDMGVTVAQVLVQQGLKVVDCAYTRDKSRNWPQNLRGQPMLRL